MYAFFTKEQIAKDFPGERFPITVKLNTFKSAMCPLSMKRWTHAHDEDLNLCNGYMGADHLPDPKYSDKCVAPCNKYYQDHPAGPFGYQAEGVGVNAFVTNYETFVIDHPPRYVHTAVQL